MAAKQLEKSDHTMQYAKACGKACQVYDIPFDVMLAVSPDYAEEFYEAYQALKTHTERCGPPLQFTIDALKGNDLYAIKEILIALLTPTTPFRVYIEGLGYQHSKRMADYILLLW